MIISSIVATANNNVIGKDNDIPWYLPSDLKYFKKTTLGSAIIMGRNCYESIGRPLPKRTNIVLTRDPYYVSDGCLIAHNIAEALDLAHQHSPIESFIIGGGKIYEQTMSIIEKLYLTEVELTVDGDVFFPTIDYDHWKLISKKCHEPDDKNAFKYCFKVFEKTS